jgi:hypothetical protein
VLTKRAVSSRLFPFDEQSVELWLQPDIYEGPSVTFEFGTETILSEQNYYNVTFGGSPQGGYFVDGGGAGRIQLRPSGNFNEFDYIFLDKPGAIYKTFINEDNDNPQLSTVYDYYDVYYETVIRAIHLGDGRIFWFEADAGMGEMTEKYLKTGQVISKKGPFISDSNMACGLLEQKLWFEDPAILPIAASSSVISKTNTKTTAKSVEEKRPGAAIVKLLRGEVYQLYLGGRRLLKVGDWVRFGDVIQTSDKSFAKLVFLDKSQMNVGPNTEIKVENFNGKEPSMIDLIKGKIRSQVTKDYLQMKDVEKSKFFIRTKNTTMGVRGTEFEISYSEENGIGTTALQMIEGAVEFTNLMTGATTLVANQDQVVAQGPISGAVITGPEIAVLGRTLQNLTSGVSTQ